MPVTVLDLRHEQVNPFPPKVKADGTKISTSQVSGGRTTVREARLIKGIALHQTACVFGPSNDRAKAHRRALSIPAHAVAFRDGVVAIPAPALWYLYTSNGLNAFTLGLEIEGQYPGLLDDPTTPQREDETSIWKGATPTPLDELTIETARFALKWLVDEGRALGCPIEYLYAHRQSNGQKPSDPGAGIWRAVAIDYGVKVLGLKTQPDFTCGDGRPIPRGWEDGAKAKY